MKILIAHNDYGRPSGEEAVVDHMDLMMRSHGHQTCFYRPSTARHRSGLVNKVRVFFSGIYSLRGIRTIKKTLHKERPDIINVHNLYPFISPAALFTCKSAGIPIVMTVHNYRLVCPTGLFLRDGRPCERCLRRGDEWGCVRYNCEKNFFKSVGYALRGYVARMTGAYQKNVDRYVCLTSFQKKKLIEAGFTAEKIRVIPNSISVTPSWSSMPGKYIAYVGRLSQEKGWDMLVEIARQRPDLYIEAAGFNNSPVTDLPSNIRLRGHLNADQLAGFYRHARFLVIPSRCYEGFPLVALEAMAMGKTVVAPDHGGFTDILGKGPDAVGLLFRPSDLTDLEAVVLRLWHDEKLVQHLGKRCFEKIKTSYSSEIVYQQWEHLFLELLQTQKN
ncbi:MAG: glycosyltransferase family 4 protein [Chitinophagaceae bacterium]|nr:glycosyltransferase family 4 protein [Chitinophagaceae bacterium]